MIRVIKVYNGLGYGALRDYNFAYWRCCATYAAIWRVEMKISRSFHFKNYKLQQDSILNWLLFTVNISEYVKSITSP